MKVSRKINIIPGLQLTLEEDDDVEEEEEVEDTDTVTEENAVAQEEGDGK